MTAAARIARSVFRAARLLAASLACAGAALASPQSAEQDEGFEGALALYTQCKWSAAYGRFAQLADEGQPAAAEIALLMLRYGSSLYGQQWVASPSQVDRWKAVALQKMKAAMARTADSSAVAE